MSVQSGNLLAVLMVTLLGSAGYAADGAPPINTTGLKAGCFYPREVANFDPLNREYLIVYAPNKRRAYLVAISPPSPELRGATALGFEGRDRICGKAGERMVTGRGMGRGYSVMDVWKLDEATVDQMLANKKARDKPDVKPAAESPGAEVETDVQPDDATEAN